MTTRQSTCRIFLALVLALSPSLAHAYSVNMGSPTANQPFSKESGKNNLSNQLRRMP